LVSYTFHIAEPYGQAQKKRCLNINEKNKEVYLGLMKHGNGFKGAGKYQTSPVSSNLAIAEFGEI